jgi:hypothetical protein
MEKTMDCSEYRDDMLDVLYGEADDTVTVRLTAHTDQCDTCRDELAGLQGVRRALQSWESPARPTVRRFTLPSLRGLAVAASIVLAFGAGLLVSRAEVRDGEVAFRFGGGGAVKAAPAALEERLAKVESDNRAAIESLKASLLPASGAVGTGTGAAALASSDQAVVRRVVQEMIRESEARQVALLQTGFQQLAQRAEAQRRYDLAQISQGFAYLESNTRADVARTNELMSHLVRAAAPAEDGK